jgi:hypothetical protein
MKTASVPGAVAENPAPGSTGEEVQVTQPDKVVAAELF